MQVVKNITLHLSASVKAGQFTGLIPRLSKAPNQIPLSLKDICGWQLLGKIVKQPCRFIVKSVYRKKVSMKLNGNIKSSDIAPIDSFKRTYMGILIFCSV